MIVLVLLACDGADGDTAQPAEDATWLLPLPDGFPEPIVPAENPATPEKFEYGRHLFFDPRLSGNGTQACADCHDPALAFTDGEALPEGSTGDLIPRNAMALVNVAWQATYTWPNPLLTTLEEQLLIPMYNDVPTELGMSGHEDEISARLEDEPVYDDLATAAFPDTDPFERESLVYALATYARGLISSDSPYDRYTYAGDRDAMDDAALRGMGLFFGEQAECYHCHSGPHLTASFVSTQSSGLPESFFNTGLYNEDGAGAYPADNRGLIEFSGEPEDMGKFRVPTLRNVALTAPYMHDGSVATLDEVIENYNRGGTLRETGDGATNPYKSALVHELALTEQDKADLKAFLESLTDEAFLTNEAYGDPRK
ncbi:MAG: di-heme enzyme [Deltaproteobacteria bacterium]|nr:di-heme enzyme [Deltaproteobacteria bacterium]